MGFYLIYNSYNCVEWLIEWLVLRGFLVNGNSPAIGILTDQPVWDAIGVFLMARIFQGVHCFEASTKPYKTYENTLTFIYIYINMVFDYFFVVWACPKSKVSNLMGNAVMIVFPIKPHFFQTFPYPR